MSSPGWEEKEDWCMVVIYSHIQIYQTHISQITTPQSEMLKGSLAEEEDGRREGEDGGGGAEGGRLHGRSKRKGGRGKGRGGGG